MRAHRGAAMARLSLSILFSVFLGSATLAGSERIPEHLKTILAATRMFQLADHIYGNIGIVSEEEAHIGDHLEVEPVPGNACAYTLRRRDGPVLRSIDFSKLSPERRVSRSGNVFFSVVYPGLNGAFCEHHGKTKDCRDELEMLLFDDEIPLASRAMTYIFAHVCLPAELPF
jgi:hypothetical protein